MSSQSKTLKQWLIVNWQKGSTRTRKSKPKASDLGTHELATSLTLNITIPEVTMPELEANIEVPQPRVEAGELDDLDAEDAPGWHDVMEEVIEENPDADPFEDVDRLVVEVLTRSPDRPDASEVKQIVRSRLRQEVRHGE